MQPGCEEARASQRRNTQLIRRVPRVRIGPHQIFSRCSVRLPSSKAPPGTSFTRRCSPSKAQRTSFTERNSRLCLMWPRTVVWKRLKTSSWRYSSISWCPERTVAAEMSFSRHSRSMGEETIIVTPDPRGSRRLALNSTVQEGYGRMCLQRWLTL
jgi:hypothetical protein